MKLVKESMQEVDKLLNGKGDNLKPSDVDPKQLEIGIAVEKEHSSNMGIRTQIALDHLAEKPMYYTTLVEAGLVDEKDALFLYHKYYK